MTNVNLDLLRATSAHHPDGSPKDRHAHHRAEIGRLARSSRHAAWQNRLARLRAVIGRLTASLRGTSHP